MNDRNKNGQFKEGNTFGKGRPTGSKNKSSERIKQFFSDFIEEHLQDLNDSFSELRAREKFTVLLEMAKYIIPTLKAQGDVLDELSDELFEDVIERIKDDYQLN